MTFFKKHKYDFLVIAAVLLIAGFFFGYTLLTRTHGAGVVVTYDGEEIMHRQLDEDATIEITEGGEKNTVVIKNGAVCVSYASCPDHICVNTGWIEYEGEMIVCLPNKIVVTIIGGEESEVDAVTG